MCADSLRPDPGIAPSSSGPSVLVVESDGTLREAIQFALSAKNCRIDMAETGSDALRHVLFRSYQVVVSDFSLPKVDGLELTRLLSRRVRSPRIVLIADNSDPDWVKEAMVAGASCVLSKPLSLTALARVVEELGSSKA